MLGIQNNNISLARAGAVAQYVQGIVLFCGGQSSNHQVHKDCLMYNPLDDTWSNFSALIKDHDEASIVNAGNQTYVIGGIGQRSVEFLDMRNFTSLELSSSLESFIPRTRQGKQEQKLMPQWQLGPSLPDVRARACAVASDARNIFLLGNSFFFSVFYADLCRGPLT